MDHTLNPERRSWAPGADAHDQFPIQNLPLGVFAQGGGAPRGGVAIGDWILDLSAVLAADLVDNEARAVVAAAAGPTLNGFMGLPSADRQLFRRAVSDLLDADHAAGRRASLISGLLHRTQDCVMQTPATIGDYTDFYAGIHHARNIGSLFRPDNPLLPNYKHIPIGYHGRASSIRVSGGEVRRPSGQLRPPAGEPPTFGPCRNLDYELELGAWIGPGNALGEPIPIGRADEHIVGLSLLNDWSARDIQAWEYQPLGPFLAKSFASTISPWVVMAEALAPFRRPQPRRPDGDPEPMPYLVDEHDQRRGALDITLEVSLTTPQMKRDGAAPHLLSRSSAMHLYWTLAQLVTHHASNGCNLRPGDLLGTGTISGPDRASTGSLMEASFAGREPIALPSGERRTYLLDGDEVSFKGYCEAPGYRTIGFGECRAIILPAWS